MTERVSAIKAFSEALGRLDHDFGEWVSPGADSFRRSALENSVDRTLSQLEQDLNVYQTWVPDEIYEGVSELTGELRRRHGLVVAAAGISTPQNREKALAQKRSEAGSFLSGEFRTGRKELVGRFRSAVGADRGPGGVERRQ